MLVVRRRGDRRTSQIGSTPYSSRFSSMKATMTSVGGRSAWAKYADALRRISFGALQLAHLALELLHALALARRQPGRCRYRARFAGPTSAALRPSTPASRNRHDGRPLRLVRGLLLEHEPNGSLAHLGRKLTRSSHYSNPLKVRSLRENRGGSPFGAAGGSSACRWKAPNAMHDVTLQLPHEFDAPRVEAELAAAWERDHETFVVDTPPPTVSGSLHVGHVFSFTQTDVIVRYQRMRGPTSTCASIRMHRGSAPPRWRVSRVAACARSPSDQRCRLPEKRWHTFGTHAALFGVNPWRLQSWMGHKRIDETMIYVHVAENHRREVPEPVLEAAQSETIRIAGSSACSRRVARLHHEVRSSRSRRPRSHREEGRSWRKTQDQ